MVNINKNRCIKIVLIIVVILLLVYFETPNYDVELFQNDSLQAYPPFTEKFIETLNKEKVMVNVFFSKASGQRRTSFDLRISSIEPLESIHVEKMNFYIDNYNYSYNLNLDLKPVNILIEENNFYVSIYPDSQLKKEINTKKIFKKQIRNKQDFNVMVEIFYSINNKELQSMRYSFHGHCYEDLLIFMLG